MSCCDVNEWQGLPSSPEMLLAQAKEIAGRAYAPYSHFHVGAALLLEDGTVLRGCNVENASYGLSACAERNVVAQMVAFGCTRPLAIAIAGSDNGDFSAPCTPCGACRQVLLEFNPEMRVVMAGVPPVIRIVTDLLPHAFLLAPRNCRKF